MMPSKAAAEKGGRTSGYKQKKVRCPRCGEMKGNLPNHLPHCDEGENKDD